MKLEDGSWAGWTWGWVPAGVADGQEGPGLGEPSGKGGPGPPRQGRGTEHDPKWAGLWGRHGGCPGACSTLGAVPQGLRQKVIPTLGTWNPGEPRNVRAGEQPGGQGIRARPQEHRAPRAEERVWGCEPHSRSAEAPRGAEHRRAENWPGPAVLGRADSGVRVCRQRPDLRGAPLGPLPLQSPHPAGPHGAGRWPAVGSGKTVG